MNIFISPVSSKLCGFYVLYLCPDLLELPFSFEVFPHLETQFESLRWCICERKGERDYTNEILCRENAKTLSSNSRLHKILILLLICHKSITSSNSLAKMEFRYFNVFMQPGKKMHHRCMQHRGYFHPLLSTFIHFHPGWSALVCFRSP